MSFWDRFRRASFASPSIDGRTTGLPTSSNGASSMHLQWLGVPANTFAVYVDLNVTVPPSSSHLHFWALQASFMDGGVTRGAGHLGLQWIEGHPGNTAVNWGGYHHGGGGELEGSASALASTRNNVNTRDFTWSGNRPYQLQISASDVGWRGAIVDTETAVTTVVRDLYCPGNRLGNIMMWSEVFAPCDGPGSTVEWSDPVAQTPTGRYQVETVQLSYQSVRDGGCTNTNSSPLPSRRGVQQQTATARILPHGARIQL